MRERSCSPSASEPRVLFALLLLAGGCASPYRVERPGPAASDPDLEAKLERFEATLEGLREEHRIPGLSVAIVKDNQVVLARGFGYADLERRIPATADTPYDIASTTKPTSAVIANRTNS